MGWLQLARRAMLHSGVCEVQWHLKALIATSANLPIVIRDSAGIQHSSGERRRLWQFDDCEERPKLHLLSQDRQRSIQHR